MSCFKIMTHLIFSILASTQTSCVNIMSWKGNDGHVGDLSTHATGYILCVEKTGSEFVLSISSPELSKNCG